jgi:hypothetical protein
MAYNRQAPNVFASNGNPNGLVAGNAAAAAGGVPPDMAWDYANGFLYVCTTTGSTSTAVWTVQNTPAGSNTYWGGTAGGTANALTLTIGSPAIPSLTTGMQFRFLGGATANSGAATMTINGGSTINIYGRNAAAIAANSIRPGYVHTITYVSSGSYFELSDPYLPQTALWGGTDSGTANALIVSTGLSLPALFTGMHLVFKKSAASNTGATTIAVDGLSAVTVQLNSGALTGGELQANATGLMAFDGTYFQIVPPSTATLTDTQSLAVQNHWYS